MASLCVATAVVMTDLSTIQTKSDQTDQAAEVLVKVDDLAATMIDMSGQVRGFLLIRDEDFARGVVADRAKVKTGIRALRGAVRSSDQKARLEQIARAAEAYVKEAVEPEIRLGQDPSTRGQALAIMSTGVNKRDMNAFKDAVARFEDVERQSLAQRRAAEARATTMARVTLLAGAVLAAGLSILLGWVLTRMIGHPLRRLAATMAVVGRTKDFSVVVEPGSNDELGQLARDFNALLAELNTYDAQLKQALTELTLAKDAAEEANVMKSQFLANMSHEIRTPLNGVLGMAQVMALNPLSGPQKERLEVIQKSGATLLAVLNDLLDLSKIEAGRMELAEAPFDVEEVAAGAYATFTSIANANGVSFSMVVAAEAAGRWRGDSVRVRQVLYNLISNALKFTREGSVLVKIEAPRSQAGKVLTLSVADTGIGIAPEALPKLFEKFVQADNTITRRFGGTGLGLTICRHMVELMGGKITVESELGAGSTFRVELPLPWLGPVIHLPAPPVASDVGPSADSSLDGLRVLAAEDNATNQLVLKTVLHALGLEPVIVENGRLAVETWARERFDLILMDIQMPQMDGVAATREIRRRERQSGADRMPIVALSANAMKHQVGEYLAAGMDAHLAKPIQLDKLYATLLAVRSGQPLVEAEADANAA